MNVPDLDLDLRALRWKYVDTDTWEAAVPYPVPVGDGGDDTAELVVGLCVTERHGSDLAAVLVVETREQERRARWVDSRDPRHWPVLDRLFGRREWQQFVGELQFRARTAAVTEIAADRLRDLAGDIERFGDDLPDWLDGTVADSVRAPLDLLADDARISIEAILAPRH